MCMPDRKPLRLLRFDYNSPGYYFVTICTHEKRFFLGRCVGARHDSPTIQLSPFGLIVDEVIRSIPYHFQTVTVDKYIIMPNHIHLVLIIAEPDKSSRASHASPLRNQSAYAKVVGYLKATASREIHRRINPYTLLWQRGSYDHIIRNEQDYQRIWTYIDTNPLNWEQDCYYSEE